MREKCQSFQMQHWKASLVFALNGRPCEQQSFDPAPHWLQAWRAQEKWSCPKMARILWASKPARSLVWIPKVPGQRQIWEAAQRLRRPQAPGLLGHGHGLSEAAAGEGPRRPLSNQACPPDSPCGLQALGSRSATKHHFTGFCDICLVFNAEPGPKGWRRRAGMQGPEFWVQALLLPPERGAAWDTHPAVSISSSIKCRSSPKHPCGHFQFSSARFPSRTESRISLQVTSQMDAFFPSLYPHPLTATSCHSNKVWLKSEEEDIRREARTVTYTSQEQQSDIRSVHSPVSGCPLPAKLETCFCPPSNPQPWRWELLADFHLLLSKKDLTSKVNKIFPLGNCQTKIANELSLSQGRTFLLYMRQFHPFLGNGSRSSSTSFSANRCQQTTSLGPNPAPRAENGFYIF